MSAEQDATAVTRVRVEGESPYDVVIGRGGKHATGLVMPPIEGVEIPDGLPASNTLRGQPCRDFVEVTNTPAEFAAFQQKEYAKWKKVIETGKISIE